ncbi:MAG: dihydrofolate reductase [Treponema bryantii]|nr:dihydrofolate reductase [Treponema bryantii]
MITLIAACSKNRVIGCNGKIPWNIPTERDRFKELTKGKFVIMGRKSFEEISHALSYCTIIVVSKSLKKVPKGCLLTSSLEQAIAFCGKDVIIAGGQEIYEKTIQLADLIYLTEIDLKIEGDRFFPDFDTNKYTMTVDKSFQGEIPYKYITYKKKV